MSTQQMPNPADLIEAAAKNTRKVLAGVKPNQLKDPTPCAKWNVQDLIDHIAVSIAGFSTAIVTGTQPPETKPGSGNLAAFDAGVKKLVTAARVPGVLQKTLQTPMGPMSAVHFLMMPFNDYVIHGWDLAKATKQDTKMDSKHAEFLYNALNQQMDKIRHPDFFGPRVQVPANASVQDKLLGAMGRKP
jgi:uncharacterized protein (TIGR03086 family)